jgi:hypothetical protein
MSESISDEILVNCCVEVGEEDVSATVVAGEELLAIDPAAAAV